MANYKKGVVSRNKILDSAKKMFYEHGYKKTTIAMIAQDAAVPVGLVAYYFKKDGLLVSIHEGYFNAIFHAIEKQVGALLDNSLQMHLIMLQIQYIGIYGDERNLSVYQHLIDNDLLSPDVERSVNKYLLESISDFCIDMASEEYIRLIVAQYGAHREIFKVFLREYDPVKNKPLLYFTGTIALRLANVGQDVIDANIKKADELLNKMDMSAIRFLV